MTLLTITYVSESLLAPAVRAAAVERLVIHARQCNATLGVTGALLFAGNRFAQTIEGDEAVADALMMRIEHDARHRVLCVVERHGIDDRSFPAWSMAYSGDSVFVAQAVARALSGTLPSAPVDVRRLLQMMRAFTEQLPPRRPRRAAP